MEQPRRRRAALPGDPNHEYARPECENHRDRMGRRIFIRHGRGIPPFRQMACDECIARMSERHVVEFAR